MCYHIRSEVAFFQQWWGLQNATTQTMVKKLVDDKQLEFVEGGWSQGDEIVATLDGRLANLAAGNEWLSETFGEAARPRIGWKVDPFGASALTPTLFDAAGFDAFVKMRVPWELKDHLAKTGDSELIWRAPAEQGAGEVFMHVLRSYSGLCGQGFDFDNYRNLTPNITAANVANRSWTLVDYCYSWNSFTHSSKIMMPWGGEHSETVSSRAEYT